MPNTQLILIEGLPGSGKTTLASFLSAQLSQQGLAVRCLLEDTQPHPLHTAASPHKLEAFARGSMQTWQTYVAQTEQSGIVTIVEGILFQNAIRLLMQNGMALAQVTVLAEAIEATIRPLRPVLIYLTQGDIAHAVERICQIRGAKFQAYLMSALTENVYAQQRGWTGIAGAIEMLRDYRALCDTLVAGSGMPKLVLETSAGKWLSYYEQIENFLEPYVNPYS